MARKRDIMVSTTQRGAEVYKNMRQIAIRRDDALTADFSTAERAEYVAMLERLEANASAMVAEHARGRRRLEAPGRRGPVMRDPASGRRRVPGRHILADLLARWP